MKNILITVREQWQKKPQTFICLWIFFASLFIYLANNHPLSSGDNVPSSLLAWNWLLNQSLQLDILRGSYFFGSDGVCINCSDLTPYFFVEAPNGHLTSTYPIGNVILTFPLYFCFSIFLHLKSFLLGQVIPSISDPAFEVYRQGYEKLAAAISTALGVVIFYLCTRLKFNAFTALTTTFIYAFATNTWSTSAQGLWQHGFTNLAILCVLLCLLKANRLENSPKRKILLVVAGIFCGFLPSIRPTNLLYVIPIITYALFTYRQSAIFLVMGLSSSLLSVAWNIYYFGFSLKGLVLGGYAKLNSTGYHELSWQQFKKSTAGLLLSPSRGFLVYTPIALFALPGAYQVFKRRFAPDEQLVSCLAIGGLLLFLQYCFYNQWWAGWCYGPRFMTDLLAVACFLIAYFLAYGLKQISQTNRVVSNIIISLFFVLASYSVFTQVVGTFGMTEWNAIPVNSDSRLWTWQDNPIQRHTNALRYRLIEPLSESRSYLRRVDGVIQQIDDANGRPITGTIEARPAELLTLTAQLKNVGKIKWYGYQTGRIRGEVYIKVQFFDQSGREIATKGTLYVSGSPKPGETAKAIGTLVFPSQPGTYRMELTPIVEGIGEFPKYKRGKRSAYVMQTIVNPEVPAVPTS